jgi:hypothetical protein
MKGIYIKSFISRSGMLYEIFKLEINAMTGIYATPDFAT